MKDAGALVVQAHEAQNRYFEGNDRALTIESKIKINEAVTQAEAALDRIKRALEDAGDPLGLGSGLPKKPEMRK
jgi:DnaJ-class molecular chaperone